MDKKMPHGVEYHLPLQSPGIWFSHLVWSPDGKRIAGGASDGTVIIWETQSGREVGKLHGKGSVLSLAWSNDSQVIAASFDHGKLLICDSPWTLASIPKPKDVFANINSLSWSPKGRMIVRASEDVSILSYRNPKVRHHASLDDALSGASSVVWTPDGNAIVVGYKGGGLEVLRVKGKGKKTILPGHIDRVTCLAWSPNGTLLASAACDKTVLLWDIISARQLCTLEGHTEEVVSAAFGHDGQFVVSAGAGQEVLVWRSDTGRMVANLTNFIASGQTIAGSRLGTALHPSLPILATGGYPVRLWKIDFCALDASSGSPNTIRYVSAKIVLVGDSGVGKTHLGWRLAHADWKDHPSTHGQQFWVFDTLHAKLADGTECEAVLWDLAGQPDYRLIHALFVDDAELALILFDPTNRQEPFKGVDYWNKMLSYREGLPCRKILVGTKADRGELTITRDEIERLCKERSILGGFVGTSALRGDGLVELTDRIRTEIQWDKIPATVTTTTFKRVKEFVLGLKERTDNPITLIDPVDLIRQLRATEASWVFTSEEMMTAVGHLAKHGYVQVLRTSKAEKKILLTPEILNNLAASFVLEARRNPKGLGAIEEGLLTRGGYRFPELDAVKTSERDCLLDAVTVLFVEHTICFRETLGSETLLIFPALINQRKPFLDEVEIVDDVSYSVSGPIENVYAGLVVLLGYTNTFTRTDQWQNQAQYETTPGEVCGFRLEAEREGEIDLVLYFRKTVPPYTRSLFQGLFESFLSRRNLSVTRFPPLTCPGCSYQLERSLVVNRVREKRSFVCCSECGEKIKLPKPGELDTLRGEGRRQMVQQQVTAEQRTEFEAALVWLKGFVRDRDAGALPSCFISYAWGEHFHERWVEKKLATDLRNAGIEVTLDRWHAGAIGTSVARFVSRIDRCDFIVVIGTPLYKKKYENVISEKGSVVAAEVDLIHNRLIGSEDKKVSVLPLLLAEEPEKSLPPLMQGRVFADFRDETSYFSSLFDLILTLYDIPFDEPAVADLRFANTEIIVRNKDQRQARQ